MARRSPLDNRGARAPRYRDRPLPREHHVHGGIDGDRLLGMVAGLILVALSGVLMVRVLRRSRFAEPF